MNPTATLVQQIWGPLSWTLLASAGILGLVALLTPESFKRIATLSSRWIDSEKVLARLEKPVDVDQVVLAHSRKFGAALVAMVAIFGVRWCLH